MFYDNSELIFKITGVYYVEREEQTNMSEEQRRHTSIAYRFTGKSEFLTEKGLICAGEDSVTYIPTGADYIRNSTLEKMIVIHLQCPNNMSDPIETVENITEVKPLFQKLLSAWSSKEVSRFNRATEILYSIFTLLENKKYKNENNIPTIIKPGVEFLDSDYKNHKLRIADLARLCFISEVHFRNIYRRSFGMSPQKALNDRRFNHACDLICSGYYTTEEVAKLSGFIDVKYFRTAFKKKFGITVGEYTRKNKI